MQQPIPRDLRFVPTVALLLACCGGSPAERAPVAPTDDEAPAVATPAEPVAEEPMAIPNDGFAWEPLVGSVLEAAILDRFGVIIDVDDTSQGRYESPYDRFVFTTPYCAEYCVHVTRIAAPLPSLAAARRSWDELSGAEATTLTEGTTAGILHSIRTFPVRRGFPGMEGETVHHLSEVARFFAVVPLDATSHLTCVGYVEHAVERTDDPAMQAVSAACMSLRAR